MIVVDTCILSEAFRKQIKSRNSEVVDGLTQMIRDDWPLIIPSIVLQEFLTGFNTDKRVQKALDTLSGFKVNYADYDDHVLAARVRSQCRKKGIQSSSIDALIAAMTINVNGRLLTIDRDFIEVSKVCHLKLFQF